jgi:hypothetical protein
MGLGEVSALWGAVDVPVWLLRTASVDVSGATEGAHTATHVLWVQADVLRGEGVVSAGELVRAGSASMDGRRMATRPWLIAARGGVCAVMDGGGQG